MRYQELTETTRNLGGFTVKVVAQVPGGTEQEVDEQGMLEDDDAVAAFLARGGEVQQLKPAEPRKGERWQGSAHIGAAGGRGNTKGRVSGLGANTSKTAKPVVTAEDSAPTHRIGLTVTDPNHPMVSKRKEAYQKSVRVTGPDREKAINSAIAHARRKGYQVHDHHYLGTVDEAQLDELSPKTLGSYAKKAAIDAKFLGHQAGAQQGDAMAHAKRPGDGADAGVDIDDRAHKRLKGVARAVDKLSRVNEFAPPNGGGDSGDYFQALASAWYNGTFDSGSLQKGIKSKEDVERLLQRGIVCPDGVTRKFSIDYNSDFDGVVISSDDYYEHADHDETDSRTGKPFGPYDYMEFGDDDLDESARWRDPRYKGQLYTQEKPDYNDTREYDRAMWNPKPKGYPGRKKLSGSDEYSNSDALDQRTSLRSWHHPGGASHPSSSEVTRGPRKGMTTKQHDTNLKNTIRGTLGTHRVPNLPEQETDEAVKLDAPQKSWSRDDMQDYLTRIKTGTKTKQDRFKPIIHGSNVKAITKDDGNQEWDLDDLARQITTRPRAILGTNAKMAKSKVEGSITYDLTLPALSGIVVDEETGEFVEITTCPGAGECQLYCYARKGGYVMFPASSMSAAQALNFLVNHPSEYMQMFDQEVKKAKALATKNGIKLLVRVHDAGDFFSKEYYDLVMGVKEQNPDCKFYFYTKMGAIASADQPDDVIGQFSPGAKSREVKTVQVTRDAGKHVKDAETLPKEMFRNLFVTDAKGKYIKDEKGRTQVKSPEVWAEFKQKLADIYKLDVDTIVTYDEMNRIPEGPKPKWNVVVFPAGHGDLGASRLDVSKQFLMFH